MIGDRMIKIIMQSTFIVFFATTLSSSVFAQGKMTDQYRQMGGIAALSEICLNQKRLENQLFKSVGMTVANNPKIGRMLFQLMALYFESYEVAKTKRVVWNGSAQNYNKKQFNCKSKSDLTLIKRFEAQMFKQLASTK